MWHRAGIHGKAHHSSPPMLRCPGSALPDQQIAPRLAVLRPAREALGKPSVFKPIHHALERWIHNFGIRYGEAPAFSGGPQFPEGLVGVSGDLICNDMRIFR